MMTLLRRAEKEGMPFGIHVLQSLFLTFLVFMQDAAGEAGL
jgi:hypothetical protein